MHLYASVHMHTQEMKMLKKYWILYLLANFLTVLDRLDIRMDIRTFLPALSSPITVAYYWII